MKIVHCSLHRPRNRESSPAASSAKSDISKFLLLLSFNINLHLLEWTYNRTVVVCNYMYTVSTKKL